MRDVLAIKNNKIGAKYSIDFLPQHEFPFGNRIPQETDFLECARKIARRSGYLNVICVFP